MLYLHPCIYSNTGGVWTHRRISYAKYAEYQDMIIVSEFSDEGLSGKNIKGRPEFSRMIEKIESGEDNVDFVLVLKLSRFGRNAADVLNSLQIMQDYGVNLICVGDRIDSSKDAGKLMISVLPAVAEIERENIRTQTMAGREQKEKEGKWNGGFAPYGYTKKLRQNNTIPGFSSSISETDWKLAQEKRKANAYKWEKVHDIEHAHILSGLLKCPCCGKSMYGNIAKAHSKDKYTRYYYYCKNTLGVTGHKCTFRINIEQTEMNRMVAAIILAMVKDARFESAIKKDRDSGRYI